MKRGELTSITLSKVVKDKLRALSELNEEAFVNWDTFFEGLIEYVLKTLE